MAAVFKRVANEHCGNGEVIGHFLRGSENASAQSSLDATRLAGSRPRWRLEQPVGFRKGEQTMGVSCEQVWREISNYVEGDIDAALRSLMYRTTLPNVSTQNLLWLVLM